MKKRNIILGMLMMGTGLCGFAGSIDPMTKAMLNSYEELLAENSQDYLTYYERAALYLRMRDYDKALVDLGKALQYTPEKEKDLRAREYALLASVYMELKDYDKALANADNALALSPNDYSTMYLKGNILLHQGAGEEAFQVFSAMQRMQSRSQEAFYGMAKASVMMGKEYQALDYLRQAENVAPNGELTYSRLGDLYMDLGRKEDATRSYLKAFMMADDAYRPLQGLVRLANNDFDVVNATIDKEISGADNKMPLYFIKATMAYESHHYPVAYDAYGILLQDPELQEASVYSRMAQSSLALGHLDDGLNAAQTAYRLDPSAENAELLAMAQLLNDDTAAAVTASKGAVTGNRGGYVVKAMAQRASKDIDGAVATLNMAVLEDPENMEALLLRGIIKDEELGDKEGAKGDFTRLSRVEATDAPGMFYQAYALASSGKKLDADDIIRDMEKNYPSGLTSYLASVYYAKEGNASEAERCRQAASRQGYSAQHEPALRTLE